MLYYMESFIDDCENDTSINAPIATVSSQTIEIHHANLYSTFSPLFKGLMAIGRDVDAMHLYQNRMQSECERLLEQLYPASFPKANTGFTFGDVSFQRSLSSAIRSLGFDSYVNLLKRQFQRVVLILDHCCLVKTLVSQTTDKFEKLKKNNTPDQQVLVSTDTTTPISEQRRLILRELGGTIDSFTDISHARCAKLLSHRAEQNTHLGLSGFVQVYTITWGFVQRLRTSNAKMSYGLKGILTSQVTRYCAQILFCQFCLCHLQISHHEHQSICRAKRF